MITVNGKDFITLKEPIFVNDKRVIQVYANNILVYPDEYPASIKIINNPTKTQYTSGERIDLTGISVQAYKADGSVWQNSKYLNGIIPLSELICEPSTINAQSINSNAEYAGDLNGYSPILCTSEESEIVFVKCEKIYNSSTGTFEYTPVAKWTIKFTPTGGGAYSVVFKDDAGYGTWLQTYFVQCVKIGEFDETQYPLEISWNAEFIVSPGYFDGSESGTQYLGYTYTGDYYNSGDWYEGCRFFSGTSGIDYSYGSYIANTRIPYTRLSRKPRNSIEFWPKGERDYIESSTAPIMGSETNYTFNTGVLNTMNNYWGRRLTSGIRNSLSTVAVKWRRSGDNQELTANYNITVMSPVPT